MRKTFVALAMSFSSSAFASANSYDLKIDLSMNGKNVMSPRVIVKEGAVASVSEETGGENTFIEVTPTEKPNGSKRGILMKFVVGKIMKDGTKKILSTPQIIALENSKAEIQVGKPGSPEALALSVLALRRSL